MIVDNSKKKEASGRRKIYYAARVLMALAMASAVIFAQTSVTVTRTATATIAANTLVAESGATGNIVTATGQVCTGVAITTGTTVQVAEYGTATIQIVTTPTPTVGDLVLCPTASGTAGYAVDAGTTAVSGVPLGTPIVGRILSIPGSGQIVAQLFGPGVVGFQIVASAPLTITGGTLGIPAATGRRALSCVYRLDNFEIAYNNFLKPVSLGFLQNLTTYLTPNGPDNYNYKMTAPGSFTPVATGSYAAWWIDRGGFTTVPITPPMSPPLSVSTVAPHDYELLRLSAVTQAGTRENTLEVFDFTNKGLGSVPGSFFNEAGFSSTTTTMYGVNAHTAGCDGTKCGGTQMDFDIQQIGGEADVEERGATMTTAKTSTPSYGFYSVCVDCNNSGQGGVAPGGPPFTAPNVAFLADARKAINPPPDVSSAPWGVAFETTAGAAVTGLLLNPLISSMTGSSDAQPIQQCAQLSGSLTCTTITTTQKSVTNISTGRTQFLNAGGTALSAVSAAYNETDSATGMTTLQPTDLGSYWSNSSGAVAFTLPLPAAGSVVHFTVLASATLSVAAPSGTQLCRTVTAYTCAAGGSISSSLQGSFATFYSSASIWYVEYTSGAWAGLM